MSTTLLQAQEGDQARLLAMMDEYYHFDPLPFDRQQAAAALDRLMQDPALGRVWLIQSGADVVGYVVLTLGYSLEYHGRDAFIDELYIQAPYRGRGSGRSALALVEAEARRLGVRALHLEVEQENTAAQAVYRKVGYVDHDRYLMTRPLADDPTEQRS